MQTNIRYLEMGLIVGFYNGNQNTKEGIDRLIDSLSSNVLCMYYELHTIVWSHLMIFVKDAVPGIHNAP